MVQRSLACLRASVNNNRLATLSNTYTTALMAYVFTLAGDTVTRGVCMAHLDSVAVTGGKPDLEVTSELILPSARAKKTTSPFVFGFSFLL